MDAATASRHCLKLAKQLGIPTATRGHGLVDVLSPRNVSQANPCSLSARTGTGLQPWHVDLSHHSVPARYLVMLCLDEGQVQVPTEFLDRSRFLLKRDIQDALSEPFLVRSGRHSFYGTILEGSMRFIRFDPGCMQGETTRARALMTRLMRGPVSPSYVHQWVAGDVLLLDNWRLLHRRTDASASRNRTLLRVTVMEDA